MRQTGERIYGPYHEPERQRWRVIIHRADGERVARFFESEAEAHEAANAARNATETRTLSQAVDTYLDSIPEKGRVTAKYRLYALLKLPECDRLLRSLNEREAARLYKERTETVSSVWVCECGVKGCLKRPKGHSKRREEKPLSATTHRAELELTRRMFNYLRDEQKWIKVNPFQNVKGIGTPGKGKPKLRVNASRTFLLYLLGDQSLEATAVLTAFMLGLRATEVVNRVVEDLDDDGWLIWIRDAKTEAGNREIEIPDNGAGPALRTRLLHLAEGKRPIDRLFGDVDRHWLHYHTVRLCQVAGVPRVTPHGLRGSAATNRVRGNGDRAMSLKEVAEWLGHNDDGETAQAHYIGGGAIESARARGVAGLLPEETDAN